MEKRLPSRAPDLQASYTSRSSPAMKDTVEIPLSSSCSSYSPDIAPQTSSSTPRSRRNLAFSGAPSPGKSTQSGRLRISSPESIRHLRDTSKTGATRPFQADMASFMLYPFAITVPGGKQADIGLFARFYIAFMQLIASILHHCNSGTITPISVGLSPLARNPATRYFALTTGEWTE